MAVCLRNMTISVLVCFAPCCAFPAAGDMGGVITGAVVDASGAPVPLARISLDGSSIRRGLVADSSGKYRADGLPAGVYTVTAWFGLNGASGEEKVILRTGQHAEMTITLGEARLSSALPLGRSNPLDLVRAAPAMTPGQQGGNIEGWGPYGLRGNMGFNSYGQRSQSNSFVLEGVENNEAWVRGPLIAPPLEEVASVTVAAGVLPAEVGHAAGAVVRVATCAGSRQFQGSAFESWRNAALDTRNFFDAAKPGADVNRFGGSVGGPIRRNKWFFFADFEIFRERQGLTITSTVPTSVSPPALDVSGGYAGVGYKTRAVAPRIGFAFDASGTGSAVFRGGFSQDYDPGSYIATGALARNPPFASRLDIVNGTYQLGPNLTDGLPPVSPVPPPDTAGFSRPRGAVMRFSRHTTRPMPISGPWRSISVRGAIWPSSSRAWAPWGSTCSPASMPTSRIPRPRRIPSAVILTIPSGTASIT